MKILLDLWFGMFIIASVATAFAILADGLSCKKEIRTMSRFERFLKSALNRGYEVESWKDYEDGDQIQVKIDGVTYLVHSANVVLIAE